MGLLFRAAQKLEKTQVGSDWEPAWADGAAALTAKAATFTASDRQMQQYSVLTCNPSDRSDMLVRIYNTEESFGPASGEDMLAAVDEWLVPRSTLALLENCEDSWSIPAAQGANVSATADNTGTIEGTNNVPIVIGASAEAGLLAYETVLITDYTAYTHVRAWVYASVATAAGALQLRLGSDNSCATAIETIDFPALDATTWTRIYLPLANRVASTATLHPVRSVGLVQPTHAALTLRIDDVQLMQMSVVERQVAGLFHGSSVVCEMRNMTDLTAGGNDSAVCYLRIKEVG